MARVLMIIGSESDFSNGMEACADILKTYGIDYSIQIASAHRSPNRLIDIVESAKDKGAMIIIAAAGMAAHLAGVAAAHTTLPILGVPMSSGMLDGLDALLSTVQMPPGVPVGSLGVGKSGAANAAHLAARIIALTDSEVARKVSEFKETMERQIAQKNVEFNKKLGSIGS